MSSTLSSRHTSRAPSRAPSRVPSRRTSEISTTNSVASTGSWARYAGSQSARPSKKKRRPSRARTMQILSAYNKVLAKHLPEIKPMSKTLTGKLTFYAPKLDTVKPVAPRCGFGKASRWSQKVGYISRHHQVDHLCTESPGPVYLPLDPQANSSTQKGCSWGTPQENRDRRKRLHWHTHRPHKVLNGPAAYNPRPLKTGPEMKFSTSKRFRLLHDPGHSPGPIYMHSEDNEAPQYSFPKHKGRQSLTAPSTKGDKIGPATYDPNLSSVQPAEQSIVFDRRKRFEKGNLQFISKQHCKTMYGIESPGPSHYHVPLDSKHALRRKTQLTWLP